MRRSQQADRDAEIVRLAQLPSRLTNAQIARQVRTTPDIVSRVRRAHGAAHPVRQYTDEEKARAKAMLDEGVPFSEIDRTMGWPRSTARRFWPGQGWTREDHILHQNDTGERPNPTLVRSSAYVIGVCGQAGYAHPDQVEGPPS